MVNDLSRLAEMYVNLWISFSAYVLSSLRGISAVMLFSQLFSIKIFI